MGYRIYDQKKKKWLDDDIYMSQDGELYKSSKTLFGNEKLTFVSQNRYVYQRDIELHDKNDVMIYVGDYVEAHVADDKIVVGFVTYAQELSAYVILCDDAGEYYTLGSYVSGDLCVVGNIFDGIKNKHKKHK